MVFSQILLCVLLILLIFSVGENVLITSKIPKALVIVSVLTMLIGTFLKPISLFGCNFYIAGFLIPLMLSMYFCFKLNSIYSLFRIIVCSLLVAILLLVYNSLNLELIEYNLLQPYILLGIVIGIASFFICKTFPASFIGVFLGTIITSLIYYSIQKQSIGGVIYIFGNEMMFTIILVSSVLSLFSLFVARRIRYIKKKKARKIAVENKRGA